MLWVFLSRLIIFVVLIDNAYAAGCWEVRGCKEEPVKSAADRPKRNGGKDAQSSNYFQKL
jgi:hypothetical protein